MNEGRTVMSVSREEGSDVKERRTVMLVRGE